MKIYNQIKALMRKMIKNLIKFQLKYFIIKFILQEIDKSFKEILNDNLSLSINNQQTNNTL